MAMLATAVVNLHQVEKIVPAVQELGRRHAGYGVTDAHYTPVGEALIWTLDKGLGPAFTPDVKDAWIGATRARGRDEGGCAEREACEERHLRAHVRLSRRAAAATVVAAVASGRERSDPLKKVANTGMDQN